MARLKLSLLGTPRVVLDEQAVTRFESAKVRALLAYLATHAGRSHNRDSLTGLLWPEQEETTARTNLRQALSNLRRAINDQQADPPFLLVSRETIRFNPDSDYWLDVEHFISLLDACARHIHRRAELCTPCAQRLAEAVKLYEGAFLQGLFVQESVAFEEWVLLEREELQRRVLQALYQLSTYHERHGAYDEAYRYAWRQIEIDPWREEAHCQVMRVLVLRGERTAALAQYETCKRLLAEGLGVEPSESTTALRDRIRYAEGDAPIAREQLALPSVRPHNLPPQPTPFIGRQSELLELASLIERPECRLISLVGLGGSGKTRVALQAATEQIEAFADGVYFVPLAPVQSSEFLPSTIGAALGFTFSGQKDERTELLDELRDKEMLLVLDNFEHLLDAVDLLAALLRHAPGVKMLTTSHERLNLQGEWVVAIEGLSFPDAELPGGTEVDSYAAIQMFLQSARRIDPGFAPRGDDWPAVARICKLVGGLPLAIELAAAWAPVLSSKEIAHEIAVNLDFLATHLRDVPQRHHSMRAVFDHSWNLLSEEERRLFMGLSVFRGGFRREAAEQAAGATLPLLSALVAKSFLRRNPLGRYEIHELLRQYAQSKLQALPDTAAEAQDRHAGYFARFVHEREEQLRGEGQTSAIAEIGAEIDNVREAWRWSIGRDKTDEIDMLLDGLWIFCEIRGLYREGDEAFRQAALALGFGTDNEAALNKRQSILLGRLLGARGAMRSRTAGTLEARKLLDRSVELLSQFDSHRELAFSLNVLGLVARMQSEYVQAKVFLEKSLTLFREVGDRWGMAYSLSDLGNIAYLMGDYSAAKHMHHESLIVSRQAGDRRAMMFCLNDTASVSIALGEYTEARQLSEEMLGISRSIAHRWGHASALHQLGSIAVFTGEYSDAYSLLQGSLAEFRDMGDNQHASMPLQKLGYLAFLQGDYPQAEHLLRESLAFCRATGYRRGSVAALNILGRISLATANDRTSWSYLQEALAAGAETESWPLVLATLVNMAVARSKEGEGEWAVEVLSLVSHHPASEKHTRDRAQSLLTELQEAQHDEAVAMSPNPTRTRSIKELVRSVLEDSSR
jgi:predicted ATPase/DNA-binding SARP family transcriptional activator